MLQTTTNSEDFSQFKLNSTVYYAHSQMTGARDFSPRLFSVMYEHDDFRWKTFDEVYQSLGVSPSLIKEIGEVTDIVIECLVVRLLYLEFNSIRSRFPDAFKVEGTASYVVYPYALLKHMSGVMRVKGYGALAKYDSVLPLCFYFKDIYVLDVVAPFVEQCSIVVPEGECCRTGNDGPVITEIVSAIDETKKFSKHKFDKTLNDDFKGNGQVKLLLDMLRFLEWGQLCDGDVLIYVGAAPCVGSRYAFEQYPSVHFYLYDLRPLEPSTLELDNVWAVPTFDDSFVQSLRRYKRVYLYSDVYVGDDTSYNIQMQYVDMLRPSGVRLKHTMDITGRPSKRVVGSTFLVLHYAKSSSVEYAEYFVPTFPCLFDDVDNIWMENYFINYNSKVRASRTLIPSRITGCKCYDCMWLDMWLVFRHPIVDDGGIGDVFFPDFYVSKQVLVDYFSTAKYAQTFPQKYPIIGSDMNGARHFIGPAMNYFTYGFVDVPVKLAYYRIECYSFTRYSSSRKENDRFVVPNLFVVFDYSRMTYSVRYRVNFQVKVIEFTYSELLSMGEHCLECLDSERFVVGVSLSRKLGFCVVDGIGGYDLIPNVGPLLLCDKH